MPESSSRPQPSFFCVALGFAVAPLAGTFAIMAYSLLTNFLENMPNLSDPQLLDPSVLMFTAAVGWAIAAAPTITIGIPLYLLLRRRLRFTLVQTALLGGAVALAMPLWLSLTALPDGIIIRDQSWLTFIWSIVLLGAALLIWFAAGAIGGIAFWFCAYWRAPVHALEARA